MTEIVARRSGKPVRATAGEGRPDHRVSSLTRELDPPVQRCVQPVPRAEEEAWRTDP